MGGRGSGHRRRPLKQTVEECLWLDINLLRRQGITDKGKVPVFLTTSTGLRRKEVASIRYELSDEDASTPVLIFRYVLKAENRKKVVNEPVRLQATRTRHSGERWWFTCPLASGDEPCLRRVGKLYLPPSGVYFGCRHCYGLTYRNCQESHRTDWIAKLAAAKTPRSNYREAKRALDRLREQSAVINSPLLGDKKLKAIITESS